MSSVRPLVYLLSRSIANGVKRAVTSPARLIGLAFFCFYYWSVLLRPFSRPVAPPNLAGMPKFELPPAAVLDATVFGFVGAMSLMLMAGLLSYRGGFKAADVDVLFPTPVDPRVVLGFRIVRDTLVTLILPLFIGLIGFNSASGTFTAMLRNYPRGGGDVVRALILAYLLTSFVWVSIGYAASLFVNRSDVQSDRNRKIINGIMTTLVVSVIGYVGLRLKMDLSVETLLDVAHSPFVRIALAPVTLATWAVMGIFEGQWLLALAGFAGLFLIIGAALRVALTQVGWMYDQAAVRGFSTVSNMRDLQRKGDMMAIQAERARMGKLKHGRIARRVSKIKVRGAPALLWKEAILQARGSLSGLVFLGTIFIAMTGFVMYVSSSADRDAPGWSYLAAQGMMVYVLCMANAQSGFIELLRRVDVQKPLPFSPAQTVFWEVAAKAVAPAILGLVSALIGVVVAPAAWTYAITGMYLTPTLAALLSGVVLLVVVLFPDVEDPTQRMFRGLMLMLGVAICAVPGIAVMLAGTIALKLSPIVVGIPVVAINLGITLALSTVAGGLYANFNPSE